MSALVIGELAKPKERNCYRRLAKDLGIERSVGTSLDERNQLRLASVAALAVDDVVRRFAAVEALKVGSDYRNAGLRHAVCRHVRRDRHVRMHPEEVVCR